MITYNTIATNTCLYERNDDRCKREREREREKKEKKIYSKLEIFPYKSMCTITES